MAVASTICAMSCLSTALFLTACIFSYLSGQHTLYVACTFLTLASGAYTVGILILCVKQRRLLVPADEEEMERLAGTGDEIESSEVEGEEEINESNHRRQDGHVGNDEDFECFDDDLDITETNRRKDLVDIDLDHPERTSNRRKEMTRL
ncbi:uncharacterized protein LOC100378862 [Saccoglossus kowalevskii]|uniref:Uncharacterized protein LOC100378862 n=1 Tax=Saccoglossus kowalevskii TaxID=10224 RepID=A0ABM0GP79_SACKO|nr:PREDICTED: uncharacterized protein LOC100378862 [Saccoglossus kowalevskii]